MHAGGSSRPTLRSALANHPRLAALLLAIGAILLGLVAGASVSVGPVWAGWAVLLLLVASYVVLRSTLLTLISVFGVITLLPFGALPVKIALTPTFLELALLALLVSWLLRILTVPEDELRLSALAGPLVLFLGFTVFSLIIGANGRPDNLTLHNYVKFVLAVLIFFSVLNSLRTRTDLRWALRALLLGGIAAALIALALYALNDQTALRVLVALGRFGYPTSGRVLRYINDDPAGVERAIGTSVDPNSFGGMLALICAFSIAQLWARQPLLPRKIIWPGAAAMALCVVLTFSRAALGGLVIATVLVAILGNRRLWYLLAGGAGAALVGIIVLGSGGEIVQRLIEGIQFRDQANLMRLAEYRNALTIIQHYPIFGVGFGNGPELGLITGVSSIYLAMAERIGLLGLGTFIAIMGTFFVRMVRGLRTLDAERQSWLLGVLASLASALAGGLLDHYYFNIEFSHMVALFWAMVGIGVAIFAVDASTGTALSEHYG
jgi:O-antigen ligase